MRIILTALTLAVLLNTLAGCDINPSKFGKYEAVKFTESITYVKDKRSGLCFAIVASRKTGEFTQSGMGLSEVPCEAVSELLEK